MFFRFEFFISLPIEFDDYIVEAADDQQSRGLYTVEYRHREVRRPPRDTTAPIVEPKWLPHSVRQPRRCWHQITDVERLRFGLFHQPLGRALKTPYEKIDIETVLVGQILLPS